VNSRTLPRAAVDSTLKLVRLPIDSAIRLLPGNGTGARPTATLVVDRADAAIRAVLASVLGDPILRESAQRQRAAAQKREQALRLRETANRKTEEADARLQQQHEEAERRRQQAKQRAKAQREQTARKRQEKERDAAQAERKRLAANDRAAAQTAEAANRHAAKERLKTLDVKADALDEKERAQTANDEAIRLRKAASRTKAERKSSPNGENG
jgi:dTMP kinase